jgi:hypothetical protein
VPGTIWGRHNATHIMPNRTKESAKKQIPTPYVDSGHRPCIMRFKARSYFPGKGICLTRPVKKYVHEEHAGLRMAFPPGAKKTFTTSFTIEKNDNGVEVIVIDDSDSDSDSDSEQENFESDPFDCSFDCFLDDLIDLPHLSPTPSPVKLCSITTSTS